MSEYEALLDGCEGDSAGLRAALGASYKVLRSYCNDECYEHSSNTIYEAETGQLIHAECGGCSCGGSGSWSYVANMDEAIKLVPEQEREP
jgi:hypothetical protein